MGSFVDDQMVGVDLADRRRQIAIQLDQLAGVEIPVLVGERLVEQVVPRHRRLVAVAPGEGPPKPDCQFPVARGREELRDSVRRIVDVRAGLSPWCAVQVEYDPEAMGAAPLDQSIDEPYAVRAQCAVLVDQPASVDRQADVVRCPLLRSERCPPPRRTGAGTHARMPRPRRDRRGRREAPRSVAATAAPRPRSATYSPPEGASCPGRRRATAAGRRGRPPGRLRSRGRSRRRESPPPVRGVCVRSLQARHHREALHDIPLEDHEDEDDRDRPSATHRPSAGAD